MGQLACMCLMLNGNNPFKPPTPSGIVTGEEDGKTPGKTH